MSNILNIFAWCFAAILFGLILPFSRFYEFKLWSQVNILRGTSPDPILISNAHFLRYLLVYPIFITADVFNLDADKVFSFSSFFYVIFYC